MKLEEGEREREKEVGVWRGRTEELEEQVKRLTDELEELRHENKKIRENLDLKEAQVSNYLHTLISFMSRLHFQLTSLAIL